MRCKHYLGGECGAGSHLLLVMVAASPNVHGRTHNGRLLLPSSYILNHVAPIYLGVYILVMALIYRATQHYHTHRSVLCDV